MSQSYIDSSFKKSRRQILDLPDEVLKKILGYCCGDGDLEFLLWSCQLVTVKDQFCHDCFHCDLCHGPYIYSSPQQQQSTRSTSSRTTSTTLGSRPIQCHHRQQRRRRLASIITDNGTSEGGGASNGGDVIRDRHQHRWSLERLDLGFLFTGVRRCPWNDHQRWKDTSPCSTFSFNDHLNRIISNCWPIFGQSLLSSTTSAAAAMAGMMRSNSHQRIFAGDDADSIDFGSGAGNGDPPAAVVVRHEPPGVKDESCMMKMNNFSTNTNANKKNDDNDSSNSLAFSASSESRPNEGKGDKVSFSCLPFPSSNRQQSKQKQRKVLQGCCSRHCCIGNGNQEARQDEEVQEEGGCIKDENHSDDEHEYPLGLAQIKSTLLFLSTSLSPSSLSRSVPSSLPVSPASLHCDAAQVQDADAKNSYPTVTPHFHPAVSIGNTTRQKSQCHLRHLTTSYQHHQQQPQRTAMPSQASLIELSRPFQLLLINKRFGNVAVSSLWDRLVFHGHDSVQARALLSVLSVGTDDEQTNKNDTSVDKDHGKGKEKEENKTRFSFCTDSCSMSNRGYINNNKINNNAQKSRCLRGSSSRDFEGSNKGSISLFSPLRTASLSLSPSSSSRNNYCDHHLRTTNTPTLGPFAKSLSPAPTSVGANPDTSTAADESFLSTTAIKLCDDNNNHNNTLMERNQWSYGRFVRRVVLNFMHAQASRDLFVETLETLSSNHRWYGQDYYALDLHANEKMRDGSRPRLPTDKNKFKTMDLDTLFGHGSGFSNLACLRLRGGFVDNQLLNALTRGMQARQQGHDEQHSSSALSGTAKITPSRLSQVFLGPGSFTDSAIERLIEVAGSSLEVVMITSCVDIGGGSLAKFLTLCPKLRVLGFYRSLTRDEDLFQGLGLDFEEDKRKSETGEVESPTVPRVTIVAPLERLELCAMLKMSSKGVATIVQGVSRTLKHLVLDSRHFHEDFLSEAILSPVLTLAGVGSLQNLVSLCFKDESLHHKHQQQHRLSGTTSHHRGPLGGLPFQRSPWLGDTLTDIWIAHGGGSGMSDFAHSRLSSMDHSRASIASIQSPSQGARDRFLSSFRCRGKALFDKICRRHTLTNTATLTSLDNGEDDEEEPYESLLERCSVQQETMFKVIGGLSRLRTFLVLCKDMIVESEAYQQRERSKARVIETNCDGGTVVEAPLAFPNEAAPLKKGTVDEAAARASVVNDDTSLTTASIMNIVRWMLILSAIMIWMVVVVNRNNADDNTQQS